MKSVRGKKEMTTFQHYKKLIYPWPSPVGRGRVEESGNMPVNKSSKNLMWEGREPAQTWALDYHVSETTNHT
jgi:hypothetical protein